MKESIDIYYHIDAEDVRKSYMAYVTSCVSPISMMDIDEMIKTLSRAGYLVERGLMRDVDDHPILIS